MGPMRVKGARRSWVDCYNAGAIREVLSIG